MFRKKKAVLFLLFSLCLFTYSLTRVSLATAATNLEFAQKISVFLEQKKHLEAYQLAQNLSNKEIGEPTFDLLFGRAALAVQKYDVASLAFERVVMNDAENVGARLGLAEAYYGLKMYDQAKVAAAPLTVGSHGAVVDNAIQTLLNKINKDETVAKERSYNLYGRMVFGYDNNVGATTDENYGRYLDYTGLNRQAASYNDLYNKLQQYDKKLKSVYVYPQLGIGGKYTPQKTNYDLFWDANTSHKEYTEVDGYDVDQINLGFGVNYKLNPQYSLSGSFYYQEYLMDGERYREAPIGTISLGRILNANNMVKIYTNNGVLAYPTDTKLSVNMHVVGLEWSCFNERNLLLTQIFYGRNQPRGGAARYNGSDYVGVDISAKHQLTQKISLTAAAVYQNSLYDALDPRIPEAPMRHDSFKQTSVGVYYRFNQHYTWYALSAYTSSYSNVFIYKYNRLEALTGISLEF